jgi:NAD(P) transhydrogenase subunit beta
MSDDTRDIIVNISYLIAAVLFIVGLKRLSSPATARRGNQIAAIGMAIAVVATFFLPEIDADNVILIVVGLIAGAIGGLVSARQVKMTAMPQMVAIFNGMGGVTAALVSIAEFMHPIEGDLNTGQIVNIVIGTIIGAISFSGSMIAFLKLQELMSGRPIVFPNQQIYNAGLGLAVVVIGIAVIALGEGGASEGLIWLMFVAALALGALLVVPIGGADMPVVIAILNSLTGLAAALTGIALENWALVVAGALVGASGSFLTILMARAMNRSITNVLFGAFGTIAPSAAGAAGGGEAKPIREISVEDAAVPLAYAQRVIIVPGYGLAVAQAQHAVRELGEMLEERGVDVRYAIHPVAGRMPGHMNVLLAEANVPYDALYEMDQINDDFNKTDVALVIGANDVTNPAARSDPSSPIYGMPILNVDQAQNIIVLKRGMKPGFAGIENELFHDPKTTMLFGDAKDSIQRLIEAVKAA